jgi:long-chain acyl-CoA synthetase
MPGVKGRTEGDRVTKEARYWPGEYAAVEPGRIALVDAGTGSEMTYQELHAHACQYTEHWRRLGYEPGQHIAVWTETRIDTIAIWWSALYAGLYFVPISTRLTPREATHMVGDSDSRALVMSDVTKDRALALKTEYPDLKLFSLDRSSHPDIISLQSVTHAEEGGDYVPGPEGSPLLYTSGTTGLPKAVERPLSGRIIGSRQPLTRLAQGVLGVDGRSVYLSTAPMYHAAPVGWVLTTTGCGATVVQLPKFDPESALAAIDRYKVTHSQWVPTMFTRMLRLPPEARCRYDLSSHRVAIHAAAPCPVPVKRAMLDWWGPIIHEYYSGTEGVGMTYCSPQDWFEHHGTVGRPLVGSIRIVDSDGSELPNGTDGRVFFENGHPFRYRNDDVKTEAASLQSGAMTLGDIGHLDDDGFLYLTDRSSFVIISGGVNIYPQEIEQLLATHPAVADVAVLGIPDEDFGESVLAIVQPITPDMAGDNLAAELTALCRSSLADLKCPKRFEFRAELPREDTGKLFKRELWKEYRKPSPVAAAPE